jgi:hypothetical protein
LSKRAYLLNPLELPAAESGSSSQETPTSTWLFTYVLRNNPWHATSPPNLYIKGHDQYATVQ